MAAYYNEIDPYAAEWLRNLIAAGLIPHGEVDERSIVDVQPGDLAGFTQCHFFAGIGGWPLALRLAGWPDDRPVWTGSCPCQPFSAAGKRAGFADERHLWPHFHRLIRECRPEIVFGEQVSSSLVVGKFRGYDVQSLWQARQFLDFRKDWLQGHFPIGLQGVPEFGGASIFEDAAAEHRDTSEQASGRSEVAGEGPRSSVRSGCRVGTRTTGGRDLPVEREAVRLVGEAQYEHAVSGSDRPEGRLCKGEHAGDPVWSERGSRHLGAGKVVRCSRGGDEDAIERLNDLIAEVSGELEEESGSSWLDALYLDLGRDGYICGACVAPAAGVGAPHIRQRLYWVAYANDARLEGRQRAEERAVERAAGAGGMAGRLADADRQRRAQHAQLRQDESGRNEGNHSEATWSGEAGRPGPTNGIWRDADWLFCRDGRWRPVEPGTFPLVDGSAGRVGRVRADQERLASILPRKDQGSRAGRLRAYGNAIVAPQAAEFIRAFLSCEAAAKEEMSND